MSVFITSKPFLFKNNVKFLEQLRQNNIDGCYAVLFTERQDFYQAPHADAGMYRFFNGQQVNFQSVHLGHLPNFLHKKGPIGLNSVYQGNWNDYIDINNTNWKYYALDI